MFGSIKRLFIRNTKTKKDPARVKNEVPRYPPYPKGLPLIPPEELLDGQKKLVYELITKINLPIEDGERLIKQTLLRFAAFVHLLPASEFHHHRGTGGMLRHGLEVSVGSVREMDNVYVFDTNKEPSVRRFLASRWRVCFALSGLLHDIGKIASDVLVISPSGDLWNPHAGSIYEWGVSKGIDRYHMVWISNRAGRHKRYSVPLLHHIITPQLLAWLSEPNVNRYIDRVSNSEKQNIVYDKMLDFFYGDDTGHLSRIVQKHDWKSVEKDLKQGKIEEFPAKMAPEYRIIWAIKKLLETKKWHVNNPDSVVWHTPHGMFLVWPQAATDIIEILEKQGLAEGLPRGDSLRIIMSERGLIREVEGNSTIMLAPETLEEGSKLVYLRTVWLSHTGAFIDPDFFGQVSAFVGLPDRMAATPKELGLEKKCPPAEDIFGSSAVVVHQNNSTGTEQNQNNDGSSDTVSDLNKQQLNRKLINNSTGPKKSSNQDSKEQDLNNNSTNFQSKRKEKKREQIIPGEDPAGRIIQALAKVAIAHPEWVRIEDQLLEHPEMMQVAGLKPSECLKILFEAGYAEPDPENILRKITLKEGRSWLRITAGLVWLFENALQESKNIKANGANSEAKNDGLLECKQQAWDKDWLDADLFKEARRKLNLSQGQLAEKLGVSRSKIAMIESGDRDAQPELKTKMLEILNKLQ